MSVTMGMCVLWCFMMRVYTDQPSIPYLLSRLALTVVNTESHELLGTDPISRDFGKEDPINSSHGNSRCPTIICPCAR